MMIISIFIVVLILWVIQQIWKMRKVLILSKKLKNEYKALPLIGHSYLFVGSDEDRMNLIQKMGRDTIKTKYGLTSIWMGPQHYTVICDAENASIVSKSSLNKADLAEFTADLLGNGSIFAPVHIWRPRRKILAPAVSSKVLNGFIEIFQKQSIIMISCLEPRAGEGTFSIWNNVTSYTMDSVCQSVLGVEMNVQTQTLHPWLKAFEKYSKLVAARLFQPWLYWDFLYKRLPVYRESREASQTLKDFIDGIISEKKNCNTPVTTPSFADVLLSTFGENQYSYHMVREELLVLLIAATDTSAVGVSFVILLLSRYLSVQEKAYEEIHEIFGDSKRPVALEDLSKLKYLEAAIRETLRLYPPVPLIIRKNDEDVKLNSEITLPAGSRSCIHIWAIHRNPRYWGADAEDFNPDRFLNGNVTPGPAYMTFSYGPRNCIGYKYAMMSMKIVLTTLLRHYKLLPPSELSPEDLRKPLRLKFNIMMKEADDFKVRLERRN